MKIIITEEQNEKFNQKIKSMVNKYGIEDVIKMFDNNTDIIKRAYQDNPASFLEGFNNLTLVEKDNTIYYVDNNRLPLFYYYLDKKNGYISISFDRIWMFFEQVIGLKYTEIEDIIKNWLEETYNLRGFTPLQWLL